MKVNIGQAVAPFQANIDQAANNARLTQALGGFLGGIQSARKFKLDQKRVGTFLGSLGQDAEYERSRYNQALQDPNITDEQRAALERGLQDVRNIPGTGLLGQISNYRQAIRNPELALEERLGLQDALARLETIASTTDVTNIDSQMGAYQKMYSPMSDPRELANQLKKAHITGQYGVQAAGLYGQAAMNKLYLENRKFENEQEKEAKKNAAINRIQQGAGSLPTLLNPIMNQFTNFSGLGSPSADSSMYGY